MLQEVSWAKIGPTPHPARQTLIRQGLHDEATVIQEALPHVISHSHSKEDPSFIPSSTLKGHQLQQRVLWRGKARRVHREACGRVTDKADLPGAILPVSYVPMY